MHVVVANFERRVLKPLQFVLVLGGIVVALTGEWWLGGFLIVMGLSCGIAGAALHPTKSFTELSRGTSTFEVERGEVDRATTRLVAKGAMITSMIVAVVVGVLEVRAGWPWFVPTVSGVLIVWLGSFLLGMVAMIGAVRS